MCEDSVNFKTVALVVFVKNTHLVHKTLDGGATRKLETIKMWMVPLLVSETQMLFCVGQSFNDLLSHVTWHSTLVQHFVLDVQLLSCRHRMQI